MRKTIVQGGCRLYVSHPLSTAGLRLFSQRIVLAVAIFIIPIVVKATVEAQGPNGPCGIPMSSRFVDTSIASFDAPYSITPSIITTGSTYCPNFFPLTERGCRLASRLSLSVRAFNGIVVLVNPDVTYFRKLNTTN